MKILFVSYLSKYWNRKTFEFDRDITQKKIRSRACDVNKLLSHKPYRLDSVSINVKTPLQNILKTFVLHFTHERTNAVVRNEETGSAISDEYLKALTAEENRHWDDIVFENRNREYGAYVVRRGYSSAVVIGLIATIIVSFLVIYFPAIVALFGNAEPEQVATPRKLVYTELSAPPPIDKPKPPPPQVSLPRLQKVIKFVPPKIVKEQINETVPTIEEIKQNETAAVAVEGPTEVILDEPVQEVVAEDENEIFVVVEQNPEFEGGYDAMMNFIKQNMKYPANARRMDIQGTVYVSFVVGKNGAITDVKVLRGFMKECDAEAVRVVQLMPAWKPGKQNGRNVNVRYTLPLKFKIS
jgi:periplasmic protein TonB